MKAKYCKCKNTYTIKDCNEDKKCNAPHYWRQGIGSTTGNVVSNVNSVIETRSTSNSRE
jgi:hypothetical protein|tara:strand:+ start:328 stop:504 length:177 start_codon:yes stop_codon:yes gene_type:complete